MQKGMGVRDDGVLCGSLVFPALCFLCGSLVFPLVKLGGETQNFVLLVLLV